jgi:polysaccharide export outer membrane protein
VHRPMDKTTQNTAASTAAPPTAPACAARRGGALRMPSRAAVLLGALLSTLWVAPLATTAACATTSAADNFVWVDDLPEEQLEPVPYRIRGKDKLQVTVFKQESLSGEVLVRGDGKVTIPLVGDVSVVGKTPPEAAAEVAQRLDGTGFIDKPSVSVAVLETRDPTFAVVGEVKQPGSFQLQPGTSVLDGVALAGGLSEFAQKERVFVIRRPQDRFKENLRVRFSWDKLSRSDGKGLRFLLEDGDVIVVE